VATSTQQEPVPFTVRLDVFEGPFDLLLQLIAKHKLDVTEIALSSVTDEFIAHWRSVGGALPLDQASEFLVVAATLLDLKAARLLPRGEVEDQDDVALLEARDLLFARLLQYKAFKEVAGLLDERLRAESARFPRAVPLDPQAAAALPELDWRTTPEQLARLARAVLGARPGAPAEVGTDHLHGAAVSVPDEAEVLAGLLADGRPHGFRALVADAASTLVVVVRFLALLEMYRDAVVDLVQDGPLGELTVRWTGPDGGWSAGGPGDDAPSTAEPVPAEPRAAELTAGALA
jgi:segregation and condensation protein A